MIRLLLIATLGLLVLMAYQRPQPSAPAPGVVAEHTPQQQRLSDGQSFRHQGFSVTPLETFDIHARVLARRDYRHDTEAAISPMDLALGWGPMSDSAVLQHFKIRQSNRWYYWRTKASPIPLHQVALNSANMHMVPASPDIAKTLRNIRKDDFIRLSGHLIAVERDDGWRWVSSRSRSDTGAGSCELIWVQNIAIEPR